MPRPKLPNDPAGWVTLLVAVAIVALGTWQASSGNWLATAIAALGVLGTSIRRGVLGSPIGLTVAFVGLAMVVGSTAGCNSYAAGWRATAAVRSAGNLADDALEESARRRHANCLGKHGAKTEGYQNCIKRHLGALIAWRGVARPAINSALRATVEGLTIAERVRGKNRLDWIGLLRPAVCTLVKITREWSDLFGDRKAQIVGYLALAQGVTCD